MPEAIATIAGAIHPDDDVIATVSVANRGERQVITTISGPITSETGTVPYAT